MKSGKSIAVLLLLENVSANEVFRHHKQQK